ncbi:MAG: hypothetical protein K0041_08900 [Acidithiobacillus sp.]|nr:hypothetical protein [Acidithiobacillus sp.]
MAKQRKHQQTKRRQQLDQPDLPGIPAPRKPRGRPRVHADTKAAQAAASKAYRDRKRAEKQARSTRPLPDIEDHGIIDLSAVPAYRVRTTVHK